MKTRIYFLDNLRSFLIFLVVVIHCGIVYEAILENTWIVVDADKNNAIGLIRMYLDTFVMFTLFFISGYFIPRSLKSKTDWVFLKSKFNRILLPWIVAVLTMIPAYKAIFLYSRGLPQQEWFSYFHIFIRTGGDPYFFADNPVMNWLWYLPILFSFQVIYLIISKFNLVTAKTSIKSGVIYTIIFGLIYAMGISLLDLTGWHHSAIFHFQRERLLIYFMVFLLGALTYIHKTFDTDMKNKKLYLLSNLILTVSLGVFTVVALNLFFNMVDPARNYFFVSAPVDRAMYYFTLITSMLSFLYIWIYTFRFYFNKTGIFLKELSNNSYYVYIIHVVVLGLLAIPLLQASFPAFAKFAILTLSTFAVSNILVSIYRKTIQRFLSNKLVTSGVLIAAAIVATTVYAKQSDFASSNSSYSTIEKSDSIPVIGLHEAALTGNLEVVLQHIKVGSNLDIKDPASGNSPLHTAAAFGKKEVAITLIDKGAEVNFINNEGSSPLLTASFFCHVEIVDHLLKNGADKNIKNKDGSTALASVSGSWEEVKGLYEYFDKTFGPLGMKIDYEYLENTRPIIADMLK